MERIFARIAKYFLILFAFSLAGNADACCVYERVKKIVKKHPVAATVITTLGVVAGCKFLAQQYTAYCERLEKEQQEADQKKIIAMSLQLQAAQKKRHEHNEQLKREAEQLREKEWQKIIDAMKLSDYDKKILLLKWRIRNINLQKSRTLRVRGYLDCIVEEVDEEVENADGPTTA